MHAALTDERVEVTRVPMDREVEAAPSVRTEGDVTIVPIMAGGASRHTEGLQMLTLAL